MCPKRALQERPAVSDELVHEVLGSDFLCLSDEELLDLLMEWKEADEGHISKRDLIEKYVCLENVSGEKIKTMLLTPELQFLKSVRPKTIRGEYVFDVLGHLGSCCRNLHGEHCWEDVFLSDWVNVVVQDRVNIPHEVQINLAVQSNCCEVKLDAGHWVAWRFPGFAVKLQAMYFRSDIDEGTHFSISCFKKGGSGDMQVVFRSEEHGYIEETALLPCNCNFLAKSILLEVTSGTFEPNSFKFEGFLLEEGTHSVQSE